MTEDDQQMDDGEDVLRQARAFNQRVITHWSDWRKEARTDFAMVSGDQWDAEDKAKLVEMNRPVIVFNRVGPVIDSVAGLEVGNRQERRFIPREMGDVAVNEMLTAADAWARDECDAEDEESDAFLDMVICGLGVVETRMDYVEDPDGQILIERVDPLECYPDPGARKRNLSDGREFLRVRDITKDQFRSMFPDAEVPSAGGSSDVWGIDDDEDEDEPESPRDDYRGRNRQEPDSGRKIRLADYQWKSAETFYRVADPATGKVVEFNEERFEKLDEAARANGALLAEGIDYVRQRRFVVRRAFIVGGTVLETTELKCPGFTYSVMTGKRDRNAGTWYGLVRGMRDPQRWANKWLSQILHIINSNAKGGVMAEASAVTDQKRFAEEWAKSDAVTWLEDGAIARGAIQPKPAITYPAGLDRLMEFAVTSIRDVSGVNLELLGMVDRQQAGILEQQRKQAGMTILATLFDSLRRYRKEQGRLMLHYITKYLSDGRLIRIKGEDGAERYLPLLKQPDTLRYDVIVDEAPSSPNQKEAVWAMLVQLFPLLQNAPPQLWAELLPYSPLPEAVSTKIAQVIAPQQPDPAQMAAQQLQMQKAQADVGKVLADTKLSEARAVETLVKADVGQAEGMIGVVNAARDPTPQSVSTS